MHDTICTIKESYIYYRLHFGLKCVLHVAFSIVFCTPHILHCKNCDPQFKKWPAVTTLLSAHGGSS